MSRRRKNRVEGVEEWQLAFLGAGVLPDPSEDINEYTVSEWRFHRANSHDPVREAWDRVRDIIMQNWISRRAGTRPYAWWAFESPEPRKRLGGIGTPAFEKLAFNPSYRFGIPDNWMLPLYVKWYKHLDLHVPDPADPPMFESEAAYLDRLGLLTDGERDCLPPDAFKPVRLCSTV